jgi:hypothetical protein
MMEQGCDILLQWSRRECRAVESVELKDGHVLAADAIVVAVGPERRQSKYFLEHILRPSQLPSSAAEHGSDFRNPGEGS